MVFQEMIMADATKIQWTARTWNPWQGCRKVSAGCKYCYMYRDKERYGLSGSDVHRSSASTFNRPLFWLGPGLVFTCSWSDWFIEEADAWREDAWSIIRRTPHLTYQILTKRPERILQCLPDDWGLGYDNVWIGVSVEDQDAFDLRVPILGGVPARVRFLSVEPLLGPVDFSGIGSEIGWVIVGGESGNDSGKWRYRPCRFEWLEGVVFGCREKGIPVFVKQVGTFLSKGMGYSDRHGGNIEEFPEWLRVRNFPNL